MNPGLVANAVRARRKTQKLSMRAAAIAGGISATTWSDIESGTSHAPTDSTQRAIATALHWPLDWLDIILAGGDPVPMEPAEDLDLLHRVDALEQAAHALADIAEILLSDAMGRLTLEQARAARAALELVPPFA